MIATMNEVFNCRKRGEKTSLEKDDPPLKAPAPAAAPTPTPTATFPNMRVYDALCKVDILMANLLEFHLMDPVDKATPAFDGSTGAGASVGRTLPTAQERDMVVLTLKSILRTVHESIKMIEKTDHHRHCERVGVGQVIVHGGMARERGRLVDHDPLRRPEKAIDGCKYEFKPAHKDRHEHKKKHEKEHEEEHDE